LIVTISGFHTVAYSYARPIRNVTSNSKAKNPRLKKWIFLAHELRCNPYGQENESTETRAGNPRAGRLDRSGRVLFDAHEAAGVENSSAETPVASRS